MPKPKIEKQETKKLNLKFNKKRVVQRKYVGKFTRQDIIDLTKKVSNGLKDKDFDGAVMASIKYPASQSSKGWRSGYLTQVGEPVSIYDHHDSGEEYFEEPKYFKEFRVYIVENGKRKGKKGKNNDCLYYAIHKVLHNQFIFKSPEELKYFLNIDREDGVDINRIADLEKKMNIRINVSGDHVYTSTMPGHMEVNLTLIDGHYEVDKSSTYTTRGVALKEKIPLIVSIDNKAYDGKKTWTITKEELAEIRQKPNSAKYTVILKDPDDDRTLKEIHEQFIIDAEILKKETKGVINMYKTGTDTKTASNFFEYFSRSIHTDKIKQAEAEWINNASTGALIFAEPYEGPLYEYDVCSMYPSIMMDNHMLFPVKKGTFMKLTQQEFQDREFYMYGIYKCVIHRSGKEMTDRLFRFNKKNHYTHFDLKTAKELGLKIEIIENEQPNFLHYPRDCLLNGNTLFYKFVIMLFQLKEKKIAPIRAKSILNKLWGYLCRSNSITKFVKESDDVFD